MKHTAATFYLLFFTALAFAGDVHGGRDPLAVSFKDSKYKADQSYQDQLRNSTSWKNFLSSHPKWFVEFNESNQRPHRAVGKPIIGRGNSPEVVASNFIHDELNRWNIDEHNLSKQSENFSGKYHNVFFRQTYKNIDVLFSQIFVKLTSDLKIVAWGSDVYDFDISTNPALSNINAIDLAKQDIVDLITDISIPVLKILPVPNGHETKAHLVYEILITTNDEHNVPSKYYTLVDANDGKILYRNNQVKFIQTVSTNVHVEASVYEHNPYIPASVVPLTDLRVDVGSNTFNTDSLGNITLNGSGSVHATFSLEGEWSKVVTDQSNMPANFDATFSGGGSQSVTFDTVTTIKHTSGYYHVNRIHNFMKGYFPLFTRLDYPLITRIDVTNGSCNAFYDGNAINFYETGGGCFSMSQVGDIVYHEYGHGINELFYDSEGSHFENTSMGEGYADIWALSLSKDPVLGLGHDYNDPNAFIRRYDINRKVYPQDITGDPHENGEIIAGAWYDVSLNLGSWTAMTDLFTRTFWDLITGSDGDEGIIYSDILLSALLEDDNDNDLTNGTPNDIALISAFSLHGITLLKNYDILHDEILSAQANQDITVKAEIVEPFQWYAPTLRLNYRTTNQGLYTTVSMTLLADTLVGIIPQQPVGTVISYFFELIDTGGVAVKTLPQNAGLFDSNIPYFIVIGEHKMLMDDFDSNQSSAWITGIAGDDATKGNWVIDVPVESFKDGNTIQTGYQHTQGGMKCAVTGNATSTTAIYNSQDVDDGKTTLQSPVFSLVGMSDPVVAYWRWYTNDQGQTPRTDFWRVYATADGFNYTLIENTNVPDHSWRREVFRVKDYFPNASLLMFRFVADDASPSSLIEAAVDDIEIYGVNMHVGLTDNFSNEFKLYPNPASDRLYIKTGSNHESKMLLLNELGSVVMSGITLPGKTNEFDISNLPNGIYFIQINGEVETMHSRIVVSH